MINRHGNSWKQRNVPYYRDEFIIIIKGVEFFVCRFDGDATFETTGCRVQEKSGIIEDKTYMRPMYGTDLGRLVYPWLHIIYPIYPYLIDIFYVLYSFYYYYLNNINLPKYSYFPALVITCIF
ncbi:hypothetical protein Glove_319g163 [Diversispora epigaea]|uniref:Uncharacterized protein n=1 Tax=Diversispora epigaea TaxID=1348612 RepID=A0A397HSS3_9GLOM|nr:hypothetical protein Glove_319g163 [Diversispora epigaea]